MEERLQDNKQEELINIIIQQLPYEEPAAVDGDYMETWGQLTSNIGATIGSNIGAL